MRLRRLLILPLVATVALAGCRTRGGESTAGPENAEDQSESVSMQSQLDQANRKIEELNQELDAARKNMSGGPGIGSTIEGGPVEGFEQTASGGVALPEDFAFAKGSAELNSEGQKAVARLAARLNEGGNAGKHIMVKGFTDDSPVARASTKEKYVDNWGLSAARAAAVVRALEKAGVGSERLTGAFRGQLDPRSEGKADQAKNRRVEIYLNA